MRPPLRPALALAVAWAALHLAAPACAQGIEGALESLGRSEPAELSGVLRIVLGLAVLSLAPALLMMVTAFTRIVIILSFLRGAIGSQSIPPNSVLVGLAVFLTFFVMYPTWQAVHGEAIEPYTAGEIGYEQALERGAGPIQAFMLRQTRDRDLLLFVRLAGITERPPREELPMRVVTPAFMISELRTAFEVGLILYLPFLVIDLVVASALMSMGMMMLPPMMVSLPLKLLLFVLADGWNLLANSIVLSFV